MTVLGYKLPFELAEPNAFQEHVDELAKNKAFFQEVDLSEFKPTLIEVIDDLKKTTELISTI